MWPNCPDEELLDELSVVVSAGWELPSRPQRRSAIRHLLLLVAPADSLRPHQAAQRVLQLLDDVIRNAEHEQLSEDDVTGCRILLGVHPEYRSIASPTRRRREAPEFLVPKWLDAPPSDPAGTFQRRHQETALRQVLQCLRDQFRDGSAGHEYDVARVSRRYVIDARRQVVECQEVGEYRIREDGVAAINLVEATPDPEGLLGTAFVLTDVGDGPVHRELEPETDPTLPGFDRFTIELPRTYDASEILRISWSRRSRFGSEAPDWGRYWTNVAVLNDGFELEIAVDFDTELQLPDLCWWFSAEQYTDLSEVGPQSLDNLVDLVPHRSAVHQWSSEETERGRRYGFIWCWHDDESRPQWEEFCARLRRADETR